MNVGDTVYLRETVESCEFFPQLQQTDRMKSTWYKEWWTSHLNVPAKVILIDKVTMHIQFEGENSKYLLSTGYLR